MNRPKISDRFWELADRIGIPTVAEQFTGDNGWCILFGHGICADTFEMVEDDPRHVPVSIFRAEMEYLIEHGYTFMTMTEGLKRFHSGDPMNKIATLTFDDGFRNVVDRAYPVMCELNLRGCFYPVSGFAGAERLLWTDMVDVVCWHNKGLASLQLTFPDSVKEFSLADKTAVCQSIKAIKRSLRSISESERLRCFEQIERLFARVPQAFIPRDFAFASWEQLRSLDPAVLEIGSHTVSHPNLERVDSIDVLQREVVQSKADLEEKLGRSIVHFCYPAGSYNASVVEEVRMAGYASAVTIKYGTNTTEDSPFELKRLVLPPTLPQFKARISGLERGLMHVKNLVNVK